MPKGVLFTVTTTVALPEHPEALVPLTVYVVVTNGVTVTGEVVCPPGIHVKFVRPVCESEVAPPLQTVVGFAVAFTVVDPLTLTVTVLVLEQPQTVVVVKV